jgi:hypothetical protein
MSEQVKTSSRNPPKRFVHNSISFVRQTFMKRTSRLSISRRLAHVPEGTKERLAEIPSLVLTQSRVELQLLCWQSHFYIVVENLAHPAPEFFR